MIDDALARHRYRQAVLRARSVPIPASNDPDDVLTTATFKQHIMVELRRDGKSRWTMWVKGWGKPTRRKDFATPHVDHGRRTAEHWFGEPIGGWHAAADDEVPARIPPSRAMAKSLERPAAASGAQGLNHAP